MRATKNVLKTLFAVLAVCPAPALAADPPALINYQGVLRDAAGAPLDGNFDMVFRFFDELDNEILVDEHETSGSGPVTVSGGLFNVELGGGFIVDGSGPQVYSSLGEVFRRVNGEFCCYSEVYLEVQVLDEVLSPRTHIVSAPYSMGDAAADPPCYDNSNRFVDCDNGTVTDTDTGLIWLKDSFCLGLSDWAFANELTIQYLADGQCGLTDGSSAGDWRLPTQEEWDSILKTGCNPAIPDTVGTGCWSEGDPFLGVQSEFYWSSNGFASVKGILASLGSGSTNFADFRNNLWWLWAVRSGS